MKNKTGPKQNTVESYDREGVFSFEKSEYPAVSPLMSKQKPMIAKINDPAEILIITSYPPRECGIATYSQDLIKALNNKFSNSFSIKVCALESDDLSYQYPGDVKYV